MFRETALALALTIPFSAIGCDCVSRSIAAKFNAASFVLHVQIVSSEMNGSPITKYNEPPADVKVAFKPIKTFKSSGVLPDFIYTSSYSASCGIQFIPGQEYLVFTDISGTTSTCSGTVSSVNPDWGKTNDFLQTDAHNIP